MIITNVKFLPLPNTVEVVLTKEEAPFALTKTAFMIALHADGSIMLATNQRRGTEAPGGHVEAGETLEEAAIRETYEEIGCEVSDVVPIGYLKMISEGEVPANWPYPHPESYQQFYAGKIVNQLPFVPGDECDHPVRSYEPHHRPSVNCFWAEAIQVLGL